MENPRYSRKQLSLRLRNSFSKSNFDTEFEISSVGMLDWNTEQRKVAGKHLTSGWLYICIYMLWVYSNPASRASKFLVGSATAVAVAVAGHIYIHILRHAKTNGECPRTSRPKGRELGSIFGRTGDSAAI